MEAAAPSSVPVAARKPLFKRKVRAQARPEPTVTSEDPTGPVAVKGDDALDLFKRSKEFFSGVVEDQEKLSRAPSGKGSGDQHDRKRQKTASPVSPKVKAPIKEDSDTDLYGVSDEEMERVRLRRLSKLKNKRATPPSSPKNEARPSPSSSPKGRPDKGKGLATPYSLASSPRNNLSSPHNNNNNNNNNNKNAIILSDSDDEDSASGKPPARVTRQATKLAGGLLSDQESSSANAQNGFHKRLSIDGENTGSRRASAPEILSDDDNDDDDGVDELDEKVDKPDNPELEQFILEAEKRRAAQKAAAVVTNGVPPRTNSPFGNAPVQQQVSDRVVKIFVTSRLGGAQMEPMIMSRRMNQDLTVVRETVRALAASRGRPLTPEERASLFLTWRGRKLYDSTTLLSLGPLPDNSGVFKSTRVMRRSGSHSGASDSDGFHDGLLHFEAWTDQSYKEFREQQEKDRLRKLGQAASEEDEEDDGDDDDADGGNFGPANRRITLKSKNFEPLGVSARPSDVFKTFAQAFRNQMGVRPDQEVSLFFDGERLDEETTVEDADVEDGDTIEVYIK